ncbi:MAG: hypothetical protein PQJ50_01050, partial [Spirochaetales bacterium]|nr:hypothetical protein [Spirochaetales bacterium]
SPGHFPMPPGVKFAANPDNKGEVTGGCIDSVTINGNPAAVIGSTVSTCDDAGQKDHCTIISIGAVVTFPIQYPGQDPEQYRRDGGLPVRVDSPAVYEAEAAVYRDQPKSLTSLQWSASQIEKGKEVTLSCATSGVRDGAAVTFSIYPDGADPEKDPPLQDIRGVNRGSRAEVKWVAKDIRKPESDNDMNWFFTAWTLYCPKEQSSTMEVTRVLPEFSELKWELVSYDEEGNEDTREEVSEIEHGLTATLSARVENMEDGENVHLMIYEEGYEDPNIPLTKRLIEIKDGMVTLTWPVKATRQRLEELTEDDELKYVFALQSLDGIRSEDSEAVQAVFVYRIDYLLDSENIENDDSYTLKSDTGNYESTLSRSDDANPDVNKVTLLFTDILPGAEYSLVKDDTEDEIVLFEKRPFQRLVEGV